MSIFFYNIHFFRKIESILSDTSEPSSPGERHLSVMTGADRTEWAKFRRQHLKRTPPNAASLLGIESAAFVLALDDYDYEFDEVR